MSYFLCLPGRAAEPPAASPKEVRSGGGRAEEVGGGEGAGPRGPLLGAILLLICTISILKVPKSAFKGSASLFFWSISFFSEDGFRWVCCF